MSIRLQTIEPILASWHELGNRFSGRHAEIHWTDIATMAAVVVGGLGLVVGLYVMQLRQQRRVESNLPAHLFQDLCQLHDLSWKERRLLTRLAQSLGLKIAAELFVSPQLFDPEQLPIELASHESTFQKIADKLFAGFEEPVPTMTVVSQPARDSAPSSPVMPILTLPGRTESSATELA